MLSTRGWKGINIILLYLLNHGSWKRRLTGIKLLYILARRWPTYIHPHEDLIERTKEAHERVIVLQGNYFFFPFFLTIIKLNLYIYR